MALQIVSLSKRLAVIGPFDGPFSAGSDQSVFCAIYVHLTATVLGDLTGHTTLWEQQSGSAITFIGSPVDTLMIDYQQTALKDDKVFRFWIDKGTPNAVYSDVTIFGNITERLHLLLVTTGVAPTYPAASNTLYTPALTVIPSVTGVAPRSGISVIDSGTSWLTWISPTAPVGKLAYTTVFENRGTGFIPVSVLFPPSSNYYTTANPAYTYRVDSTYSVKGVLQTYQGQPSRFALGHTDTVTDSLNSIAGADAVYSAQTFTSRTKINRSYQDSFTPSFSGAANVTGVAQTFTSRQLIKNSYLDSFNVAIRADTAVRNTLVSTTVRTRASLGG